MPFFLHTCIFEIVAVTYGTIFDQGVRKQIFYGGARLNRGKKYSEKFANF